MPPTPEVVARIGSRDILTLPEAPSVLFFEAGMGIDADGSPRAYHPDSGMGLDALANAGRPGRWWGVATDTGRADGTPVLQGPDDPAPGFYVSTTSLHDPSKAHTDPARYVDAETMPYFVLPGDLGLSIRLGDFGYVVRPSAAKASGGVFADVGPKGHVGEGSIALAEALGIPSSPRHGGCSGGVLYVVFSGSAAGWPLDRSEVETRATALFTAWGGMDLLRAVLPDYC